MTFSPEWEALYAAGHRPEGTYPHFEKLVSMFVAEAPRMLEIGCGSGSEIPFFSKVGFGYYGIDGSRSAIARIKRIVPSYAERVFEGDFTKALPEGGFDFICDRASIAHNDIDGMRSCVKLIFESLSPGGVFIGCDWFSTSHSEATCGVDLGNGTRGGYEDGQFIDVGKVHFTSEDEIVDMFKDFDGLHLQERIERRPAPNGLVGMPMAFRWVSPRFRKGEYRSATWDLVVRKPA